MEESLKFKVYVRLRPVTGTEGSNGLVKPEFRLMYLNDPVKGHSSEFVFDRVFEASTDQATLFDEVGKPLVEHVLQGYNACCFAYGPTGSGKTYSMFGREDTSDWELRGIIPRAADQLFKAAKELQASGSKMSFFVSFMEIYLEQVRDLGWATQQKSAELLEKRLSTAVSAGGTSGFNFGDHGNLDIWEDPSGMTLVKDLTYIEVSSLDDVLRILKTGYAIRQTASTAQNDVSSRSHTVFTISVVQYKDGAQPVTGRLHLVDLAGSERINKAGPSDEARVNELKAINKSLTALGKVVMTLAQGDPQHVPFRDSKLTRILKDSLLGNSYTSLIAAMHPTADNYDECFNTLQFALRCQAINTAPTVNVVGTGGSDNKAVGGLMQQIKTLQGELEYTHAHYQKLIESVAGPGWAKDMGNLERGANSTSSSGQDPAGTAAAAPGVRMAPGTATEDGDTSRSLAGEASSRSMSRSLSRQTTADPKVKRLEMQLDMAKDRLTQSEARVHQLKMEMEEYRDKATGRDHHQFSEIKTLRQQLAAAKAATELTKAQMAQQMDDAKRIWEAEQTRLTKDCEALRAQLAQLSGSVSGMLASRSEKTAAERREREALQRDAERRIQEEVAAAAEEKHRHIDNLKQQSGYFIKRKGEEAATLRQELERLQRESGAEIAALKAESEYVAAYAEKVTEVLRRMENGVYGVVDKAGVRSYKIPPRDKPAALDPNRLKVLRSRVDFIDRLVEATRELSPPGPLASSSSFNGSTAPSTARFALPLPGLSANGTITLGGVPSTARSPSTSPRGGAGGDAGSNSSLPQIADIGQLRLQVEGELRNSITSQVVADLQSDKTVEYIRSLEAQVARYRQEVQAEKRRNSEMTIALRAAQRTGSRPDSPMNVAISGATLKPPASSWGWGHGPLASSAGVASLSGTTGTHRPATAF